MKPASTFLFAILILQGWQLSVKAQISNDENSISVIAIQCATSSGYPASNYTEYSTGLAKTLALLNGDQQKRVFGYLPNPPRTKAANQNYPADVNGTSGNTAGLTSPISDPGLLADLVGQLNSALAGSTSSPPALIGTAPPASAPDSPDTPAPDSGGLLASSPAGADAGTSGTGTSDPVADLAGSAPAGSEPAGADAGTSDPGLWEQLLAIAKDVNAGYQEGGVAGATEVVVEAIPTITETIETLK